MLLEDSLIWREINFKICMGPWSIYKKCLRVLLTHVYWFRATGGYICGCGWPSNLVTFTFSCQHDQLVGVCSDKTIKEVLGTGQAWKRVVLGKGPARKRGVLGMGQAWKKGGLYTAHTCDDIYISYKHAKNVFLCILFRPCLYSWNNVMYAYKWYSLRTMLLNHIFQLD